MSRRSFRSQDAGSSSSNRVDKPSKLKKRDAHKLAKLQRSFTNEALVASIAKKNLAPAPIVTLTVGPQKRLFAAHEDVLCQSAPFAAAVRNCLQNGQPQANMRISLPEEEPEVFSAILEYLYKGDYYPRLVHNKQRHSWELEDSPANTPILNLPTPQASPVPGTPRSGGGGGGRASGTSEATIFMSEEGVHLLRDTVIYCAADRYGLEELKSLALTKQGLQSGIDIATIIRSATYTYAHTPDEDSRLRAHYLALIIRCRKTFQRSGTMQAEMERGGSKLFFDLFVAMCNHLDDSVVAAGDSKSVRNSNPSRTPRTT